MLQGQMVRFRWHAEGTERIWIFHSVARMCERRGRDGAYTGMLVHHVSVGWGERERERERERGSADTSDASRTETVLLEMTCYTRLQEFIAGSKFIPRSQLLYGPCMSSLTAAVFTSRLDWYRKSRPLSCRRVFFLLLLLRLSSRPYAANNASAWKVYPPSSFQRLDFSGTMTGSVTVLLSAFLWLIIHHTCTTCARSSDMLQFI